MALERIGLGGKLTFDEKQAVRAMGSARDSMGRFTKAGDRVPPTMRGVGQALDTGRDSMGRFVKGTKQAETSFNRLVRTVQKGSRQISSGVQKIGKGAGQMAGALRSATMAAAPFTIATALGTKKAANFEHQMSAVKSISGATGEEFASLSKEAKRMGIVSAFSATQSAEGMENLARAGAKPKQIIAALSGVMNAAAADGIDLGTSASIVSKVVKGMGREWGEAGKIADILALASARSNTNIVGLGEAFTYGVSTAKNLNMSIEETTAIFGKLADAGLQGSMGGTAFANMMNKITKPTRDGSKLMKQWGINLTHAKDSIEGAKGELLPFDKIIGQFKKQLDAIPDTALRARRATELFGIRGARAFNALSTAGPKALRELRQELELSTGAAERMANIRLDNFTGQVTLLGSSMEGFAIEFFQPLLKGFTSTVKDMIGGVNAVLFRIQALKKARVEGAKTGARTFMEEATAIKQVAGLRGKARSEFISQLKKQANAMAVEGKTEAEISIMRRKFADDLVGRNKKLSTAQKAQASLAIRNQLAIASGQARIAKKAREIITRKKELTAIEDKYGKTAGLVAQGVMEAIDDLKTGYASIIKKVKELGERFRSSVGDENIKRFTKIALIAGVIIGVLAPVGVALLGIGFVITSVIVPAVAGLTSIVTGLASVAMGAGTLMAAAFWPIVAIAGIVAIAFALVRKENESIGETVGRVWGGIKTWALDVYNNAIYPFWMGLKTGFIPVIEMLGRVWDDTVGMLAVVWNETVTVVKEAFGGLIDDWGTGTSMMGGDWFELGKTVASILGSIAKFGAQTIGMIFTGWGLLVKLLAPIIVEPFAALWNFATRVFDGIKDVFKGNFAQGMKKIGIAVADFLLFPFRMMLKTVMKLIDLVPGLGDKVPKNMRDLIEHGLGGPPKKGRQAIQVIAAETEKQAHRLPGAMAPKKRGKRVARLMKQHGLKGDDGAAIARSIMQQKASDKKDEKKNARQAAKKQKIEAKLALKDERTLNIKNSMCVDGKNLAVASAEHKQSILERSGATTTAYQKRMSAEHGTKVA